LEGTQADAADVLTMSWQIQQQAFQLQWVHNRSDAVESAHSSSMQPAVCPGCAEQAARVISTELQDKQQAGVW
jgi:hypothetical protein